MTTDGRYDPRAIKGDEVTGHTSGYNLKSVNGTPTWVFPTVILLAAGSTAANVPADAPVGTIILVKA